MGMKAQSKRCEYNLKCKWYFEWTLLVVELNLKRQHHHHHHHQLYIRVWSKKRKQKLPKNLWNKINRSPPAWYIFIQCWDVRLGRHSTPSRSLPNMIPSKCCSWLLFRPSRSVSCQCHFVRRKMIFGCDVWTIGACAITANHHTHTHNHYALKSQGKATFFLSFKEKSTRKKLGKSYMCEKEKTKTEPNTPSVKSLNNKRSDFYV